MATLAELSGIENDFSQWGAFIGKVRVAATIKAAAIIDSATPGATALDWAKGAIANPDSAGDDIAYYVVASNAGVPLQAIYDASDNAIQGNVNAAVDAIYGT